MSVNRTNEDNRHCITTRAQREMFLTEQTLPDANCTTWTYRIVTGKVDLDILAMAIKHLALIVPLLQTRFVYSDGELWQIHDGNIHHSPTIIDLSDHTVPLEEAMKRMREAAKNAWLITDDQLWGYTVYVLGNGKYILCTRFHHGIIDGRSSPRLESLLIDVYNNLKQDGRVSVQTRFHFDALASADASYQASSECEEDHKFWQAYVQRLKRFAYTQRTIHSFGAKATYRQTLTLDNVEYQILQQAAEALHVPESFIFIGISALLLRNLVGHEYVSLSLPVHGTHLNQELGMTANVLPLLLHIPAHATIAEVIHRIAHECKSTLKHQRYRIEEISRIAGYGSKCSFGPSVNIMRDDNVNAFEGCSSSLYYGGTIDIIDLNIIFCIRDRIDIIFEDTQEGHSEEQLAALRDHLVLILDQVTCMPHCTVAKLDERCNAVKTVDLFESFYANRRRPIAAGFLQWSRCCDFLVRVVHSNTWLGDGNSPFAISKILLHSRVVGINKLEHAPNFYGINTPGTVIAINETSWLVAAADGMVKISGFLDEFGQCISAHGLAKQCNIIEGNQLPIITPEQGECLEVAYAQTALAEPYWSERLINIEPCQLSFVPNTVSRSPDWAASPYQSTGDFSAIELLTAWLIYIARDTGMFKIQIGWDTTGLCVQDNVSSLKCMFAKTAPFATSIQLNDTFSNVVASVESDYKGLINHLPCLMDTLIRHAENLTNETCGKMPWTVGVSVIDTKCEIDYATADACEPHGDLMTLVIHKQNGSFQWIYDKSRISGEEVDRISSRLLVLLKSAYSNDKVDQPVARLDMLPKAERDLLLYAWNQTTDTFSTTRCLHQSFEEQVQRDGMAIAVEFKGNKLSYTELNVKANRLAHYLIVRGVKPDDRIALCIERSTTMIVALLGILKAGGAYVPLDPVYSSQRLTYILQNSDPTFVLTDAAGRRALADHQVSVIDLDKWLLADMPKENPNVTRLGLTPNHLAYVIYTSGSTGTPKGVMIEHRQIIRLFEVTRKHFDFNKDDKWCLFHSFSFDVSVWEMWGALSNGSQLLIVSYDTTRSPDEFYDWISSRGITVLNQTPSSFKSVIWAKDTKPTFDQLRYLIFAGEEFDPSIAKEWWEEYDKNGTELVNMYGPTETVHATYQRIETLENAYSIGRPLADLRTYLLDFYGEPVPLGAAGELYIGGAGVARGYLSRPDLTTERFLCNPFSDNPSARMYRTGDRARYLPDGNLVYLGRTDQQVKIRGFRIELGEIEAHLVEHPQVREAVVRTYGDGSDTRLVAYVVIDAGKTSAQTLRSYLSSLLPDYMIPSAYVCVASLPLTPNGKLDRRALPNLSDEAFAHQQYEPPQSKMEETLANIWRDLLGIEHIGRQDNFFALGGHSLLVVRLMARLRQIGLDTTVHDVFDAANLATLAAILTQYQALDIPPNFITTDSTAITPEMLPLISLSQTEIDAIIAHVPGGVANIQDIYGLAPLQSGMLFHHIKTKHGDPYLIVSRMRFTDRISFETYTNAVQKVIERHDITRTVFIWNGLNEPAQVVLRQVPTIVNEITLDDTDERALEQLSRQFNPRHYRLDLTQAPLLRLMASTTSEGSWVALLLMHHIIIDHLTLKKIMAEVSVIFDKKSEELATPSPFRHFVAHAQLGFSPDLHEKFFIKMLGDIDEPTLPFGLNDVALDRTEINEANQMLPQTLNDQLREHARKFQVSLASLSHLVCAQVLARASGRESVVFGTVLLGRLQSGDGNDVIMGPMINTLPIRIDVDKRSVKTALCHTHAQLSALLTHEHAPLVLAQRCSMIAAGLPLFSTLLNYRHNQKSEQITASLPGVTFLDGEGRTNYPLTISVDDNDSVLFLSVQVMLPMSAARICGYMRQALESITDALADVTQKELRTMEVIPSEERTLLLHTWNQTTTTSPPARCLHQLFEVQVKRDGQAIAVECNGETLTYAELNTQVNRLAHYLIARGVRPDDRIALCVERSPSMIVAMLGILKAGGAYVPLDPNYSSKRLTHILKDADPVLLMPDSTGRRALGEHPVTVVDLDKLPSDNLSIENPNGIELGLAPNHLAYVIYTSGSTGTPKGVMVEHQHVVRLFEVTRDKFDFSSRDHWCLFHSFSFDVSVWEIWGAFLNGSQLSIVPYNVTRSANELYDWICSRGITLLNQIPSAFKTFVRAINNSSRSDRLRYIVFAGEALDPQIVKEWNAKNYENQTVLVNMYGPTETTVYATYQRLNALEDAYSIGRPLPDLRAYVLDAYGEPVPLGAEGELYIGGAGVARGYLNRPDLTEKRFLNDPFSDGSAARLYRTGDRARYLPDGNLVYLGRTDQQVKIRGFRIELGEIEAHLVQHPQVHESIVQPHGVGSDARLVAYVVTDTDSSIAQDLRIYLSTLLPEYMVPAAYVCLPSLPLTTNGKLDRRALPAPNNDAFAREQYESPQSEMEQTLAEIWRDLLGIERISRHDNFFALGGHSLLVVRLLAQLRQIGFDATVRKVFDAANLATLAAILTQYQALDIPPNFITTDSTEITPEMLPLISLSQTEIDAIIAHVPGGVANIQDIYGLAPLQSGMLFHHIKSEHGDPYLIVLHMNFDNRMSLEKYVDAFQHVISRHDITRTVFIWNGLNEPAQVVQRQVPTILNEITLNDTDERALEQLSRQFNPRHYRLDLTQAPLLRLMASTTSDGSWVALLLMHHIIIDHLTLKKIMAEVSVIFDKKSEELATLSPFRHFVAHARLGFSPDLHEQFFTKMLGDIDEPTLPFGLSDVALDRTEINEANQILSQTFNDQLREHARKFQVSLASLSHLAWAQVLARASGREAVVFGTVLLGRLQTGEGNDQIIGPMINTLPIRIDVDGKSVETVVQQTHARMSALLEHEHASLVLAQRCSGVSMGLPLFSAILNYRRNQKREQICTTLPGVTFIDNEGRTHYPISMSIDDNDVSLSLAAQIEPPVSSVRICSYMQQALESLAFALVETPQQRLRTLEVIPPEERTLLLHTWNQTTATFSLDCCLHRLFEATAEEDGGAIAVECNGEVLSYSELNLRSNRLAHYLVRRGVKPDDRIALCAQRNVKLLVSILGILKCGGAYVPLDPKYPSRRLKTILQDSNALCILTDMTSLAAIGDHQVPIVDMDHTLPVDLPIDNLDPTTLSLTSAHLAYIIYTSGSTGTPKGVMVEHRNATNCIYYIKETFKAEHFNHISFSTSINFDMSLYECFVALSMGTTLHVSPDALTLSKTSNITMLSTVPSVLAATLKANSLPSSLNSLHLIGEPLKSSLIKQIFEHTQIDEICNLYGQTETSFLTTIYRFKRDEKIIETIGRPISNTQTYLLDSQGEPVPLGAEGELYIGGAGVARGYLNHPDLTTERFLPNPFSNNPSARMYRTGDRARYLPDGNVVYLGRNDQQVKIRGFRIELGEIESTLVAHSQVREVIVQPYDNGTDTHLVAYLIADERMSSAVIQNLRNMLSSRLPFYMVPSAFVFLPSVPLTPNGKLDRKALPPPNVDAFAHQRYESPQNGMEKILADIWSELLGIERISRHDNFFELGGHSLLVMHFINKVKLYNIHITTRGVFSFPILKNLAEQITKRGNRMHCDAAIPVRRYGSQAPLFMLPDGMGDISYAFELAHDIDANVPVYVLPWSSPEDNQPSSIEEMAAAMIIRMKKIQENGPYFIAGYSSGGILAYEMVKQLIRSGDTVLFLGLIDTFPPTGDRLNETESFLSHLIYKFPVFKTINDPNWWARIIKMTPTDAMDEIRKTNIDLKNIDIEWVVLQSNQCHKYQHLCALMKIAPLPTDTYLFKAKKHLSVDALAPFLDHDVYQKIRNNSERVFNLPKLGWESHNVSTNFHVIAADGDHRSMMTDPKNRSLLGQKISKLLNLQYDNNGN